MRFESPGWLFLLAILPPMIWLTRKRWRRGRGLPSGVFPRLRSPPTWRVKLHKLRYRLYVVALSLLIISLAGPQAGYKTKAVGNEVDIVITLDISMSMLAEDLGGKSRLEGAKKAIEQFVSEQLRGRAGLVVFAKYPLTLCPLTADKRGFLSLLKRIRVGLIEDGTAIGSALLLAARRLEKSRTSCKAILLLTDGQNNWGIDPIQAAAQIGQMGIKVYTIGMGSPKGAPIPVSDPIFGKRFMRDKEGNLIISKLDEGSLRSISSITGGTYIRAIDFPRLETAFEKITSKLKGKATVKLLRKKLFWYPIVAALLICLGDLIIRLLIPSLP